MSENQNTQTMDQNAGLLSKWGILALGIGGCIGSGVISLLGIAIGMTGHSAWLAFLIALVMGSMGCIPIAIVSSSVCLYGGPYSLVTTMLGKKFAGIFVVTFFLNLPSCAMYGLAMAEYMNSLFPSIPVRPTAILLLTFFTVYNMLGVKATDKLQKVLSALLLVGLGTFIAVGLTKCDFAALSPTSNPAFLMNGQKGLMSASFLLMSAVSQQGIMYYSRLAKHPRKDVPFALAGTTLVLFIMYIAMAVVASSVLPIEAVANQPLTYVAQAVLPYPLFVFFMIAGPMMALATSLNSGYIYNAEPIVVAVNDGWLSKKVAATNRRGAYWVIYLLMYLAMMIPMALGWDIAMVVNVSLLIWAITNILQFAALAVIPKKYPEAWANRLYGKKLPMWTFYLLVAIAVAIQFALVWNSIISVPTYILVVTVVTILVAIPYSIRKVDRGEISTLDIEVTE